MAGFEQIISRGSPTDPLIPETLSSALITEDVPRQSVLLTRARRVPMTAKTMRQPVLASLPAAYWVNGDTGLKQTTAAQWENKFITAEELAAIVPIPDAYFDDASIPLWDSIRPLLAEAIGKAVDEAGLFGVNTPTTWPDPIIPEAISRGNTVDEGDNDDLAADVAELGVKLAEDGYPITGFASSPGFNWKLVGMRSAQGVPIYTPSLSAGTPASLYGYPLNEVMNGAWNQGEVSLLAADWSKFVIGIRQDITYKIFEEGVISDDDGAVILNLMQQDSKAMRVVFRVGFQVANPINRVNGVEANRYPAAVLTPAAT